MEFKNVQHAISFWAAAQDAGIGGGSNFGSLIRALTQPPAGMTYRDSSTADEALVTAIDIDKLIDATFRPPAFLVPASVIRKALRAYAFGGLAGATKELPRASRRFRGKSKKALGMFMRHALQALAETLAAEGYLKSAEAEEMPEDARVQKQFLSDVKSAA